MLVTARSDGAPYSFRAPWERKKREIDVNDKILNSELSDGELDAAAGASLRFVRERMARFQHASSIADTGDDTPLNWLGLFNANG